jgi:2-haloacid dehalogenase
MAPQLVTFDIFGTVLDWRRGMTADLAALGLAIDAADFDRIIDRQGALEQLRPLRSYRDITAASLVDVAVLAPADADAIGAHLGTWPLYPDSKSALRRLMCSVPCAAMSNSDRIHGVQVQATLGFQLSAWFCAEDVGRYKPDPRFWREVSARLGVGPGPDWWHVSAYADYDGQVASSLGLTTVFVSRPHARPGPATHQVANLTELAALLGV